ncbi:MAG: zinc-dependent metalloprotease [Bacteroidota bacterium]
MKFLKPVLTAAAMLCAVCSFSQAICAFDHVQERLLKGDSAYRKSFLANEAKIQQFIRKHPARPQSALRGSSINVSPYLIPVVVHVIHTGGAIGSIYNPTDAQITGAINYLNQVYNGTYPGLEGVGDLGVQFVLAARDTNCNSSTGIDRLDGSSLVNYAANGVNSSNTTGVSDQTLKNFDRWDPVNYYNIWVVNKIDGQDGTSGQFVAGYAYFAGSPASYDGTIMLATQMITGQKTLPHEIGHALALYHPFQNSTDKDSCEIQTDCTANGDKVCDTDPISFNQLGGVVDFTCRTGTNACTGTAYSINTEHNFMNYTSCYTLFTAGQSARMQAAMALPSRQSLVNSSAIGAYPTYNTPVASCTPATGATGLSNNYAGILNVSLINKSFSSSTAKIDGGYIDNTGKCLNMIQIQKGNTYTINTTVLAQNIEQLRIWIDYNNDGVFDNTTEQLYYNGTLPVPGGGTHVTVPVSFTVPGTAASNTVLRMRVMDDLAVGYPGVTAPIGGCTSPYYGQAEDYPIYLSALLPVKFEYFNGIKNNNDALLSWKTSSEENAKEFHVEKSADGISFNQVGTVTAANLSSGSVYSFTDKNITGPENYYRLRQIDIDGKAAQSKVVLIKMSESTGTRLKIVNNPFTDQLDIVLNGIRNASSTITVFDVTGRKIFSRNYTVIDGQVEHIDLSGAQLKAGMYIVQAQTGDKIMTAKVIRQ